MDAVAIMEAARIIGVRALTDFFMAMAAMKAHWYNLMAPTISDPSQNDINRIFPPLSSLLNIEIRIGSFNKMRHLAKMPLSYRRDRLAIENSPPKL